MQKKVTIYCLILLFTNSLVNAQISSSTKNDSINKISFSLNADLVSRYIWRGLPLSLNPNIQPYASVSYKNFTLGAWGSYAVSAPFAEADLFLSYDLGPFTLYISDYYNEDETDLSLNDYWNFKSTDTTTTPHSLEGQITFNGTDNLPLSITAATFFFGNDKNTDNKNYYSTYLEVAYTLSLSDNKIKLFVGGTTGEGYYADKAALVNVGLTASRELKLSDSYSMPINTSFIFNPNAKDVFFVFGITF